MSLVVQAGAIGGRGEVFVLDMGEPVRIIDLARNMIELSGKEPERDIRIEFIGARPGEKLHEELWSDGETVSDTGHAKIHLVTRPSIDADGSTRSWRRWSGSSTRATRSSSSPSSPR